jgi:hypothetical protein
VTHTVADAEAAIARHPTDLTQLSMAADLLTECGDPRGEDFAACLSGALSGGIRRAASATTAGWNTAGG